MTAPMNPKTILFASILAGLLAISALVVLILSRAVKSEAGRKIIKMLGARVRMWWTLTLVLAIATLSGSTGSLIVFGVTSFLLLREFITITPTRKGDHHALFWVFLLIPLQYCLLAVDWYGLFVILIPVYAFLLIPARIVAAGDARGFLERAAKIQWALMLCVYCVSHAPALLRLRFEGDAGMGLRLLVYLVIVTQAADIIQRIADAAIGRHKLLRQIHDELSTEGFLVGTAIGVVVGVSLWWATPFSPLQAAGMSVVVCMMGYVGKLCLAAIRKDRGKAGVVVVETRPSMMDRVMSLCFAAPVFFHLTRYFFLDSPMTLF